MTSPKIKTSQVARSTPFDNSSNGFTATNVQEAIEEASSGSGFSLPQLNSDPVSPTPESAWVLKSTIKAPGEAIGLLLALTDAGTYSYKLSYKTLDGVIVRTTLTS